MDLRKNVDTRFDASNYKVKIPLPLRTNTKVIGLMKGELGRKIMEEFVALRPNMYSCLTDDGYVKKKAKGNKST